MGCSKLRGENEGSRHRDRGIIPRPARRFSGCAPCTTIFLDARIVSINTYLGIPRALLCSSGMPISLNRKFPLIMS